MRIALFSWEALESVAIGGVAVHVSELARALVRKGHEVHIFTRALPGQQHYEQVNGVFLHRCEHHHDDDFLREMGNMCRSFEHHFFTTERLAGKFEIVHAHDWMTAEMLSLIPSISARRILTIHSTEFGRCGNNLFGGRSETVRQAEWRGVYLAERVICVSQALKNEICWLYQAPPDKVQVIYNGVNLDGFDEPFDAGSFKSGLGLHPMTQTIVYAGRMVYQKGVDVMIEALPMVLRHVPEAHFIFAGDGDMRWQLEETCRNKGIYSQTLWLGAVKPSYLKNLYRCCDAVCVPSRNEPFGIVILEAWAARKPVVATKNGGPGEFVQHDKTGFSVDCTPESIAWGIGHIFANFEHARWMGQNGRGDVEYRFTWDNIAEQTLQIYAG